MSQLSLKITDGRSVTYISGIINGRKNTPSIERFVKIAVILGITIDELYYGTELVEMNDAMESVFLRLDPEERQIVLKMTTALLRDDQKPSN